jgi:hypothetical protein
MTTDTKPAEPASKNGEQPEKLPPMPEQPPVQRQHELILDGRTLSYYTTAGTISLKNEANETEAQISSTWPTRLARPRATRAAR